MSRQPLSRFPSRSVMMSSGVTLKGRQCVGAWSNGGGRPGGRSYEGHATVSPQRVCIISAARAASSRFPSADAYQASPSSVQVAGSKTSAVKISSTHAARRTCSYAPGQCKRIALCPFVFTTGGNLPNGCLFTRQGRCPVLCAPTSLSRTLCKPGVSTQRWTCALSPPWRQRLKPVMWRRFTRMTV
jgi:hypothetical protein